MKTIVTVCLCLLIAVAARADFQMPESVYRMDRLEEAKTAAKHNGSTITIIFTHEKTSCSLCKTASLKAAATLGVKTVVVYVNADNEWRKLPVAAQKALSSPEAGRFVPKAIIIDPEMTKVFSIVPYADGDEYDRLLQAALKKLPDGAEKSDVKLK